MKKSSVASIGLRTRTYGLVSVVTVALENRDPMPCFRSLAIRCQLHRAIGLIHNYSSDLERATSDEWHRFSSTYRIDHHHDSTCRWISCVAPWTPSRPAWSVHLVHSMPTHRWPWKMYPGFVRCRSRHRHRVIDASHQMSDAYFHHDEMFEVDP